MLLCNYLFVYMVDICKKNDTVKFNEHKHNTTHTNINIHTIKEHNSNNHPNTIHLPNNNIHYTISSNLSFSIIANNSTNSISSHINALLTTYEHIKTILTPNLPSKHKPFLHSFFSILTSQFQTFLSLTSSSSSSTLYQTTLFSNLNSLSTSIASLLTYIKVTPPFLSLSSPISFSLSFPQPKSKLHTYLHHHRQTIPLKRKPKLNRTTHIAISNDSYYSTDVTKTKLSPSYTLLNSRSKATPYKNNTNNNKYNSNNKHIRSISMEDFATTSSCVHRNKRSYSEKKMDSYSFDKRNSGWKGRRGMIRSYGVDEINEFDFDFGGAKPSAYAKYLIRKYKDVVENYERIDTEEFKSSGKKGMKDYKKTRKGEVVKRSKKSLKGKSKNSLDKFEYEGRNGEGCGNKGKEKDRKGYKGRMEMMNNTINVDRSKLFNKIQVMKKK